MSVSPVTIVGNFLSPYVRKVLVCLQIKGVPYRIDPIVPFYGNDDFSKLSPLRRIRAERHLEEIETRFGRVRVKRSDRGGPQDTFMPEHDDCERLAELAGVSVRAVWEEALVAAAVSAHRRSARAGVRRAALAAASRAGHWHGPIHNPRAPAARGSGAPVARTYRGCIRPCRSRRRVGQPGAVVVAPLHRTAVCARIGRREASDIAERAPAPRLERSDG